MTEVDTEPMTLIERLRCPEFVTNPSGGDAFLDVKQTRATMEEAAALIEANVAPQGIPHPHTPRNASPDGGVGTAATQDEVERVARAITVETMKRTGFWTTLPTPTAQTRAVDIAFPEALPLARAAIEAMREPTKAMYDAGLRGCLDSSDPVLPSYQAMIDAALGSRP